MTAGFGWGSSNGLRTTGSKPLASYSGRSRRMRRSCDSWWRGGEACRFAATRRRPFRGLPRTRSAGSGRCLKPSVGLSRARRRSRRSRSSASRASRSARPYENRSARSRDASAFSSVRRSSRRRGGGTDSDGTAFAWRSLLLPGRNGVPAKFSMHQLPCSSS